LTTDLNIAAISPGQAPESPKPKDAGEAAKQFEALLIGQMLRSAHESGDDEDPTNDTMSDLAAQNFSQVMADNGGFGLAKLIVQGLGKPGVQTGAKSVPK
jgi:Rod binding domain-containing protein